MTIQIQNLTDSKEIDMKEMSAVRGALCVDVQQSLNEAAKKGPVDLIAAAAECLAWTSHGVPVCPA
jgi:hypothetical protein